MAESVETIVKRSSIYIPPDNRRCFIKRLQTDGTYESTWQDISKYVTRWGTIQQGFPDGIFLGEYQESDLSMSFDNSKNKFNDIDDSNSLFYGYSTRYKTLFKVEIYAVDVDDNDVLLKAWYGISFSNPITDDYSDMSFTVSPTTKIFQFYQATGIATGSGTTAEIITRLVNKEKDSVSLFSRYFTGFSINPSALSVMTISSPVIGQSQTVLDAIKEYSFYQDFFYYVDNDGNFVWDSRAETATVQWEFNGAGQTSSTYGTNIQSISSYYNDIDNTYTKVVIDYGTGESVEETTWTIGDGSVADIYGEKIFSKTAEELSESEADTIASRILTNYKNPKEIIQATVTGAFQLQPKDKIQVNYKGEVDVINPFIIGVSELNGTDVLAGRTGSIRLVDWIGKVYNISIDLDNFNITQKWREI